MKLTSENQSLNNNEQTKQDLNKYITVQTLQYIALAINLLMASHIQIDKKYPSNYSSQPSNVYAMQIYMNAC